VTSSSYRQIIRSTAIIGSSTAVSIGLGLLRMKVAAVLLGPAGVGLIGLLQNLMGTIGTLAGLGVGTAGTRQVARASQAGTLDMASIARVSKGLLWLVLLLAAIGAAGTFWLRAPLAELVLGDIQYAREVGWLGVGVFFSVAVAFQAALMSGFRRIGDQARLAVWSGLLVTVISIAALWWLRDSGLLWFVLAFPAVTCVLGWFYVRRVPVLAGAPLPAVQSGQVAREALNLVRLGFPFMVSSLGATAGVLIVRGALAQDLGEDALGHFHAAWAISITYVGFVLGAMAQDYYPRLTGMIHDPKAAARLVDEQTEVALLLGGPVLVLAIGLAPLVLRLLYSDAFYPAADILRWQMLANVLKVASAPMVFILLAKGKSSLYMVTELLVMATFVGSVLALLGRFGLEATGLAFIAMYLVHLPLLALAAYGEIGYRWPKQVVLDFVRIQLVCMGVLWMARESETAAAALAIVAAIVLGIMGWKRLK
jgi:PST family polysaccharide transporter